MIMFIDELKIIMQVEIWFNEDMDEELDECKCVLVE